MGSLALTAISFVGFVLLVLGSVLDWTGFSDDPNDNSAFADIVWSAFALGGILALILLSPGCGAAAAVRSAFEQRRASDRRCPIICGAGGA